jgi:hypothetical protein
MQAVCQFSMTGSNIGARIPSRIPPRVSASRARAFGTGEQENVDKFNG